MRFLPLAVSLVLATAPLVGQAQMVGVAPQDGISNRFSVNFYPAPAASPSIVGSVFLLPGWLPGTLQLNGDSKPFSTPLKYDIYSQELRAKRLQGDSIIVPLLRVKEFSLAARRFLCYPAATLPTEVKGGCGEVLYENPVIQLLKYQRKEVVQKVAENRGYAATSTSSVLEEQTSYYLRYPADGHFTAVKPKRASLEQALAGQPAALAALKARKGSIGNEAELAAAVAAVAPMLAGTTAK